MTRLLTDGAESGDLSRIINPSGVSASGTSRTGNYAYRLNVGSGGSGSFPSFAATSEFYARWGFRASSSFSVYLMRFLNGASQSGGVTISGFGGAVTISGYDGSTLRVTSPNISWLTGAYHVVEVHYKHAASPNGVIEIKFDGHTIASYTGTVNSQSQTDTLQMYFSSFGSTIDVYYDDVAVNNVSGGMDNSWVGDGGVLAALVPDGAGNYTDLIPDSGTAYQRVDEVPSNGDTDYVYESTVDKKSTYAMSAVAGLPSGASISRVWVELSAKESAADGDKIATLLRSATTDSQGSDQNLSVAYQRFLSAEYLTDPADAAAWTEAKVNALEAGAVVR